MKRICLAALTGALAISTMAVAIDAASADTRGGAYRGGVNRVGVGRVGVNRVGVNRIGVGRAGIGYRRAAYRGGWNGYRRGLGVAAAGVALGTAAALGNYDGETGYAGDSYAGDSYAGNAYASAYSAAPALAQRVETVLPRINDREEAIGRCLEWAKEYIPPDTMHSPNRSKGYEACMHHVGHRF